MNVGDLITFVDTVEYGIKGTYQHGWRKGLVRSLVGEIDDDAFFAARGSSPFLFVDDEGTRWIRGHHDELSEAGKALLAAYALYRGLAA